MQMLHSKLALSCNILTYDICILFLNPCAVPCISISRNASGIMPLPHICWRLSSPTSSITAAVRTRILHVYGFDSIRIYLGFYGVESFNIQATQEIRLFFVCEMLVQKAGVRVPPGTPRSSCLPLLSFSFSFSFCSPSPLLPLFLPLSGRSCLCTILHCPCCSV